MLDTSEIVNSMMQHGQTPPKDIVADGQLHRYPVQNGNGRIHGKSGWYVIHTDGPVPVGFFGDWRKGTTVKWVSGSLSSMDYMEQVQTAAFLKKIEESRKNDQEDQYRKAAESAKKIYESSKDATDDHPYLIKKKVHAYPGVKQAGDTIIIPVLSEQFQIQSLQYIRPGGEKKFLPKGKMKAGFFIIQGSDTILICEGYATGATLHECTGHTVFVAFNAGNLLPVAQFVKATNLEATIILCGDNDRTKPDNTGATKAKQAAESIGARCILPEPNTGSDFNDLACESGHDAVKILFDEPNKRIVIPRSNKIPEQLLNPGGIIQRMMESIEKCSAVSIPFFSLGASLATIGSVIGQKLMTETGLRTNLYVMALGYSGTGKSGIMTYFQNMLQASDANKILAHSEFTSATAILQTLKTNPISMFYVDEVGTVLSGLKNPTSPESGIPRMMTKLFSSTDRSESKGYADIKHNIFLPYHHMSFYGASPPEVFWDSMSSGQIADGFLARMLVFEDQTDAPKPKFKKDFSRPTEIIEEINKLSSIETETDKSSGNMEEFHRPIPNIVKKSKAAQEYFDAWSDTYHELKNQHKKNTSGISSIYARAAEHAGKVALIIQASCGDITEVSLESVQYACSLMDYIIENTIRQIEDNIADTETAKCKNKILKGIKAYSEKNTKKYGISGATLRDIQRGPGQGLVARTLKEILESMVVAERIFYQVQKTSSGKDMGFYIAV